VVAFFRVHPALTPVGHARHAVALAASGDPARAREAARKAWLGGALPRSDEDRLLGMFGSSLTQSDHDRRMEKLLAGRDTVSATRLLPMTSAMRQPLFGTRLAMLTKSPDAAARLGSLGSLASTDAGVLMDRARWLRDGNQIVAARSLMAQPRQLSAPPVDAEKWLETLLVLARGAAADGNHQQAFQIASQLGDAYAPGTFLTEQSVGERDDYTSLAWLAGTTALHQLGRPADAATAFARYARGGKSSQVLTKGLYWAGRAAQQAGQSAEAMRYFEEAAAFPELFYGQLSLERLGRPVPAPNANICFSPRRRTVRRSSARKWSRRHGCSGNSAAGKTSRCSSAPLPRPRTIRSRVRLLPIFRFRSAGRTWPYGRRAVPATAALLSTVARAIPKRASRRAEPLLVAGQWHHPAGKLVRSRRGQPGRCARHDAAHARHGEGGHGKLGMSYDLARLTRDPEHNIQLGSFYFSGLMDQWGGSAPLAVASYNAGAGNVRKWIRQYGDPRLPGADMVRWIEDIPFSETRGYVQRVLENAVVYDAMNPSRARTPANVRLSTYLGKSGRPG
jgi:soluble lytic murein transglycosylase